MLCSLKIMRLELVQIHLNMRCLREESKVAKGVNLGYLRRNQSEENRGKTGNGTGRAAQECS